MVYHEKNGWLVTGIILFIISILLQFISLGFLGGFADSIFIFSLFCIVFHYLSNIKETNREMFINSANCNDSIIRSLNEISEKLDNINDKLTNDSQ